MRRPLLAIAMLLLAAVPARSQTITRGPLIQNPDADATKATFVWWTNTSGNSTVEYGLTPGLGSSVTVPTASSCEVGSAGTCHTVTVSGLSPDTTYYYRLLTNGVQVKATTYFTTLATPGVDTDLHFTVIGDWGQATSPEAQIAALQNTEDPPMILTVGDNTYTFGFQSELDSNALAYYASVLPRTFFFPALGNHDYGFSGVSSYASLPYTKTFALPRNSTQPERYYSFDSGQAHFVVLDTGPQPGTADATQTAWLQNDLANSTATWKFAFLHHAPYSCASGSASFGSNLTVRNAWGPLFERYGVDVVFIGHDHIWERSTYVDDYLANGSTGQDGLGTYYVMTGGGGASLDGNPPIVGGVPTRGGSPCYWVAPGCPTGPGGFCSIATYQYTSVRITANVMTLDGIDNAGTVFDSMTINKAGPATTTSTSSTTTTSSSTSSTTSTSTTSSTSSTTSSTTSTSSSTSSTSSSTTSTSTTSSTSTTALSSTTSTSTTTTSSSSSSTTTSSSSSSTTSTSSSSSSTTSTSSSLTTSTSTSSTTTTSTSSSSTTSTSTSSTTTTSTSTTLPCADVDADGICDSADPCINATDGLSPRLTVTRLLPPPDDETLKVKGTAVIPAPIVPPLKPHENGVRFLLADGSGASLIDVTIPPGLKDASGTGWIAHPTAWTWRSTTGLDGVRIVKMKILGSGPGRIGFKVVAKNASLPLTGADLPLGATIVFDPPQALTGRCGDLRFPGPPGVAPACEMDAAVSRVRCR